MSERLETLHIQMLVDTHEVQDPDYRSAIAQRFYEAAEHELKKKNDERDYAR